MAFPPVVLAATFLLLQLPLLLLFASASVIVFILCLFVACAPMCEIGDGETKCILITIKNKLRR